MPKKKIFLIAGEVSGDLHGAHLVRRLKQQTPELEFYGLGGKAMEAEGVELLFDLPSIAAVGLGDVLIRYFDFRKIFYQALDKVLKQDPPDVIILIDYPGFNLRFAKKIKKRIPIIYFISPQVWAWGRRRIKTIPRMIDKMLVILPFEVDVYKGTTLDCEFVGHPLVDKVKPSKDPQQIKTDLAIKDGNIVALMPGSRELEVKRHLPVLLGAAQFVAKEIPNVTFLLILSNGSRHHR